MKFCIKRIDESFLELLCLKSVSSNLKLNFIISIKYNIKLPNKLSTKVFKYYNDQQIFNKFSYEELKFFYQQNLCLNSIIFNQHSVQNILLTLNLSFQNLIELRFNNCTSRNFSLSLGKRFISGLLVCHKIRILELLNCDGFLPRIVCQGLENSTFSLRELSFLHKNQTFQQTAVKDVAKLIGLCSSIEKVSVRGNTKLTGSSLICKELERSCETLKHIDFSECFPIFGKESFYHNETNFCENFHSLMECCTSIEYIGLAGCIFINEEYFEISQSILSSCAKTLKTLDLGGSAISMNICVINLLQYCTNLESITLYAGANTNLVTKHSELFNFCTTSLKNVKLSFCSTNEKICRFFGKYFEKLDKLESITLTGFLGDGFKYVFYGFLNSRHTLKCIRIEKNSLNKEDCIALKELLKNCFSIREINSFLYEEESFGIFDAIHSLQNSASTIKIIRLFNCIVTDNMLIELNKLFLKFKNIEEVTLEGQLAIGPEFLNFIEQVIRSSKHLINLIVKNRNSIRMDEFYEKYLLRISHFNFQRYFIDNAVVYRFQNS